MSYSILHFITALFHEAKDKVDHHRQNVKSQREMSESTIERWAESTIERWNQSTIERLTYDHGEFERKMVACATRENDVWPRKVIGIIPTSTRLPLIIQSKMISFNSIRLDSIQSIHQSLRWLPFARQCLINLSKRFLDKHRRKQHRRAGRPAGRARAQLSSIIHLATLIATKTTKLSHAHTTYPLYHWKVLLYLFSESDR